MVLNYLWCVLILALSIRSKAINVDNVARPTADKNLYLTSPPQLPVAWQQQAAASDPGRRLHGKVTPFKVIFGAAFLIVPYVVSSVTRYLRPSRPTEVEAAPSVEPGPRWKRVRAAFVLITWMVVSTGFILFNKWLFTHGGFPYPIVLTAMHQGSCWVVFSAIACLPHERRRRIMPDADAEIPWDVWAKGLGPAAALIAVTLGSGNLGLLYASVAFIQMVRPVRVVLTAVASFLWGLEVATPTHVIIALVVFAGVALAAASDANFSLVGLICQVTASSCDSARLIIMQGIMQGRLKLDPITTLLRITPVAGVSLCIISCFFDGEVHWSRITHVGMLVLDCLLAVLLNVLVAFVVKETSAFALVLAGVIKDIITIAFSVVIWKTPISSLEVVGYFISLTGIFMFKVYKDNFGTFMEKGFLRGFGHAFMAMFPNMGESGDGEKVEKKGID